MSAIDQRFAELRAAGKKAFLPFLTAGDPSLAVTAQLLEKLSECGAAMAEVGIPYSDPIADGPVIQASYTRSLEAGIKLKDIFSMVAEVTPRLKMPLVSMASYSIIQRVGKERYVDDALKAGFSGAIVPDLLVEEAPELRGICRERDFSLIHLVTPTTPNARMLEIAKSSTGFIYFVSITGITGERNELPPGLLEKVQWLRERTELPICIGFGISRPEHIRALAPVADGLIVGSALVRRATQAATPEEAVAEVGKLARELVAAFDS
ncbi:tryptophan synthase subunit alpha [Aureliella helgolandensis]|uniref:Tryptophan synthase alpha chain n=1 Tax=Aureliella helgolandensis TaxID=2527968 RepID=A0A518GGM0_9BACT|nr:tryptophan synthase subunit alpha [Aureliella helgolandensis]QDV27745.1 Tryptophan synthase alpha chain [Aureliella helgolandensis]